MKRIYDYFQDAGHGWLKVPRKELKELGIENEITAYSYQKNDWVYLEEDCDMSTFLKYRKERLPEYEIRPLYTPNGLSAIRNYSTYIKVSSR